MIATITKIVLNKRGKMLAYANMENGYEIVVDVTGKTTADSILSAVATEKAKYEPLFSEPPVEIKALVGQSV